MDGSHIALAVLVVLGIAIPVIGFWSMSKLFEKDQAIDAATFLALRDLREWLERNERAPGRQP